MVTETINFADDEHERRISFLAPQGHEPARSEVDEVEMAFREEYESYPQTIRLVGIYTKQGRLALDVVAHGTEASLHAHVKRWSSLMYPNASQLPVGHEWAIDSPQNIRRNMIE